MSYLDARREVHTVLCLDSIVGVALQEETMIVEKKRKRNFIVAVMTVSPFFDRNVCALGSSTQRRKSCSECGYEGRTGFDFLSLDQGLTCDAMCKRI